MLATVSCCICRFAFISKESDLINSIRNTFIVFHNNNALCFHHSFSSHLDLPQGTFIHYPIYLLVLYSSAVESCYEIPVSRKSKKVQWNSIITHLKFENNDVNKPSTMIQGQSLVKKQLVEEPYCWK